MAEDAVTIPPAILARWRTARHVVLFSGSGISAESGIPTFRDAQVGLWARHDPATLATRAAFDADPSFVYGWYEWRRSQIRAAHPGTAHHAVVALSRLTERFTIVTQNVDDLHERAGSGAVIHLHGEIAHPYCESCRAPHAVQTADDQRGGDAQRVPPPTCTCCGGRVRPGVVWFGEPLPALAWQAAVRAAESANLLVSVGTSAVVQPAASLIDIARGAGATMVQVNPAATAADDQFEVLLVGRAGDILLALANALARAHST